MKKLFLLALVAVLCIGANAQRFTDKLSRGLVAMKVSNGIYCSWRVLGEEYYDVTYNLYRDGTQIASGLTTSNYTDAAGSTTSSYTVSAVVRGVEQQECEAVKAWASNYKEIKLTHEGIRSTLVPNDACCADVDGDGVVEILMKFDNLSEIEQSYPKNGPTVNGVVTGEYSIFECLKLDGTRLWWVNCGPNMGDFQNNEQNIVAYDWDQDGKAEALMRAADGTVIHASDGKEYVIGNKNINYRSATGGGTNWFMHDGAEYLVYMNGKTGVPYVIMDYPLKRLENGETNLEAAWGDGYGHRSTKHFFGAPYLDGRKPSIFLARGIYTRHKMIAYNVDPQTHELTERWRWYNNEGWNSPWYGNGYHNYAVADVDWDGRDEICFGSMVIDDNGKGLSTTGLGHGDAQHHGDLDPYTHGHEIFACNEDEPSNNYRDATTSKIRYRKAGGDDDGRCIAGNFCNDYPGAMAFSAHDNPISCVTNGYISGLVKNGVTDNFRIYWDGDLQEETFNYTGGKNTAGGIYKYKNGLIETLTGSLTNNDTKGTPCYQGDILGDWREEVIMRTSANNIRIYTTKTPTTWRNYTLWHDHQYRNAMVWQMCGYNQPPHTSYFLGELEGITIAPPPLTMNGRTEIKDGGTISHNDQTVITCETGNMTVSVSDGATPYLYIDNAPSWVQGTNSNITNGNPTLTYTYYTHTLTGGAFAGEMRLVKQGDGKLVLPTVTQTYSGPTDVWAGTLQFDGTMQNSPVWLNRHSKLVSNGGNFAKGIQADYNATICPGGEGTVGNITTDQLTLNFGSRVVFDFSEGQCDQLTLSTLVIEKKKWPNGGGPAYSTPVFQLSGDIAAGDYVLATIGTVEGDIDDLVLEGPSDRKMTLTYEDGQLKLNVQVYEGGILTWTGAKGTAWDLDNTQNFVDPDGNPTVFVPGSKVTFDDTASGFSISVKDNIAPKDIVFNNEAKNYILFSNQILGEPTLTKNGAGKLTIQNTNQMGNTVISGGTVVVNSLANNSGTEFGALGDVKKRITIQNGATLTVNKTSTSGHPILVGQDGGVIEVAANQTLTQQGNIAGSGKTLTKKGSGTLNLPTGMGVKRLVIQSGTVQAAENSNVTSLPDTVEFLGGTLKDPNDINSSTTNRSHFIVPAGKTGTFYADGRCAYTGKLLGAGTLNVYSTFVRCYFQGNWSAFEGTVTASTFKSGSYDPQFIFDNTYGLPKATLRINSGVTFENNGKSMKIGCVTGTGTLGGNGTYTIGGNNKDMTVNFSSTSPIIKEGEGIMTCNTPGKLTKTVTVKAGELHFDTGESTSSLFGGALTADGTAKIVGNGQLASLVMKTGTQLVPRSTEIEETFGGIFPGKVKSTAAMNFNAGSSLNIVINSTAEGDYSTLEPAYLTMNGTVTATLTADYQPKAGDTFTIWTVKNTFSGTPQFDLPALPLGLGWDTSAVSAKTGVLRIVEVEVDGDVDEDGNVSMADVAAVISAIAGTASDSVKARADVNGDGKISIADVTAVILLMAQGK